MSSKIVKTASRSVAPLFSQSTPEARKRVLNLYKAWYRQVPAIVLKYDIPVNEKEFKDVLKKKFLENQNVTDIRVVDMLVVKGQMELLETVNVWKTRNHIMEWFEKPYKEKPKDFLSKFYNGHS